MMTFTARIPPEKQRKLFGHPIGLFVLFLTEMWERFSYYGMRGLLKAYMIYYLFSTAGLLLYPGDGAPKLMEPPVDLHNVLGWDFIRWIYSSDTDVNALASHIYGLYTALVYATPFLGGIIADRWVGRYKSVIIGAVVMALGHFVMASQQLMFVALGLLIVGNGFFKPNISVQVGDLYPKGDSRSDSAYTIFYMGINLGAMICNLVCATLAATMGWDWGFAAAGVGLCIGLVIYLCGKKYLPGDPAKKEDEETVSKKPLTAANWKAIWALVALCVLNVAFWAVYEQQGNSIQTWADTQIVWPTVLGFQIPQAWYQSFNPFMILVFAPLLDTFWGWQKHRGKEPSTVSKMAMGSLLLGSSFIVLAVGAYFIGEGKGSPLWLFFFTVILTIGELYLSPIGLSLVKKVSPVRIVSMMMGVWLAASFIGNYLSGEIGTLYTHMPKETFFLMLCAISVCTGIAMWLFNKPLKNALEVPEENAGTLTE